MVEYRLPGHPATAWEVLRQALFGLLDLDNDPRGGASARLDHPAMPRRAVPYRGDMTQWALGFVADGLTEGGDTVLGQLLAGQWWIPLEGTMACGVVVDIAPEHTNDNQARRLVCDKAIDHVLAGDHDHRQVTDITAGSAIEWSTTDADAKAAELFAAYQRTHQTERT